ncbi:hypothetical protein KIN20_003582 [Parelaphostrongylus tenuis]|uniref:Uncharacterized protein n=1 Tax=Parelaphostrongylus tenuis TaxID=148309 RepID=A0AAD5QIP8_PARTN|nr:hypothetical protein KIN20_003582 [Parelaphostrongylus tenuis]
MALVCMTVARPYRGGYKHSAHHPSKDSDESGLSNGPDYSNESDDDNDECPHTSDSMNVLMKSGLLILATTSQIHILMELTALETCVSEIA